MKNIKVKIQDASTPALSYQCGKCGYFDFEQSSIAKAVAEIKVKEHPLKLRQKIIKLSGGRLGMYISKDVARSLNLHGGEDILVSVPSEKRLLVDIGSS
jgi:hypothetical protein